MLLFRLLIAAVCVGIAAPVFAQAVQLESIEGNATISGDLLSFDGIDFKVRTPVGIFTVNAATVRCRGDACPDYDGLPSEFSISGPIDIVNRLVADIINDYSIDQDADVFQEVISSTESKFAMRGFDGEDLALIDARGTSSENALRLLLSGGTDIAISERRITAEEAAQFQTTGKGQFSSDRNERTLALDGLVALVSPDNPVKSISTQQLALIFSGKISNWAQVGGSNTPIELIIRPETSAVTQAFHSLVMAPNNELTIANSQIAEQSLFISDTVQNNLNAIGIDRFSNRRDAKALGVSGVCGLPIEASVFTIKSGEYPLAQPVFLYFFPQTLPLHARGLVEFSQTSFVQSLVLDAGLVDGGVALKSVDNHGQYFVSALSQVRSPSALASAQNMITGLSQADRLSTMFWFEPNSDRLTPKSRLLARKLASFFNSIDMSNKEVLLLGFTDQLEAGTQRADLSQTRADEVRQTLLDTARNATWLNRLNVAGFESIAPIGCNEDETGRNKNRRVEVWLRNLE